MRVLTIVGNRPQFVKAAPLSLALRRARIDEVALHSGQHYDAALSDVFYRELELPRPAYDLDLRSADVELMRGAIRGPLAAERPDWVIVFGDTNTTLAGTLAADELGIPVAHVEAGLRSGDLSMPEERNRIAVDELAALLLAPDAGAAETLAREGARGRVEIVGDVMADALRLFGPHARGRSSRDDPYLLATVHREANVAQPRLGRIVDGLNRLSERVVLPLHPRTRLALAREGLELGAHVEQLEPVGYLEMVALVTGARVVVTDSGGLQKEAYWAGVPCVTLRPSTEWTDTVRVGANVLVDDDPEALVAAVAAAAMPPDPPPLYGDGEAADLIAAALLDAAAEPPAR
jgi:UDP-GlcNAc3NAcA epimerase